MDVPPSPSSSGSRSASRPRLAPSGIGEAARRLPVRSVGRSALNEASRHRRDVEIATTTVVGMAALLAAGPEVWIVALLLVAATGLATFRLLVAVDRPAAETGIA